MRLAVLAASLLGVLAGAAEADTPEQLFNNNCAICHQVGGKGVEGQFPRLAGRAGVIAAMPQGREFLVSLVLNGMSGTVTVDGKKIVGVMPDFSAFADDDLAAILTYVAGLGGTKAVSFAADELKAGRAKPVTAPTDLATTRNALQAARVIP
ncbi:MAG: cytochrome c [Pseudomonadota bacterium]